MSVVQHIMKLILPARWSAAIEAQSRQWVMRCACGHEISIWDAGGIRYKAAGKPRRWARCPHCGFTWHRVEKHSS